MRLVARADVFIQNLAPDAARRLQLGSDQLRRTFPTLIIGSITGYGEEGPYCGRKAYDLLVQSEAGVVSVTGSEEAPAKTGIPVADIAAGMYLFSGVLAAIYQRQQTGQGTIVAVSMFDALTEWMGYPLLYTKYGGSAPVRNGAAHAAIAPYGPFQAADGKTIVLAIQNQREWRALCREVLGNEAIADDARFEDNSQRVRNRKALEQEINAVFGLLESPTLVKRLEDARIAYARMNSVADVIEHPQLHARRRWRDIKTPAGPVKVLAPVLGETAAKPAEVPALGQHTELLLREVGYSQAEIEDLRQQAVVA